MSIPEPKFIYSKWFLPVLVIAGLVMNLMFAMTVNEMVKEPSDQDSKESNDMSLIQVGEPMEMIGEEWLVVGTAPEFPGYSLDIGELDVELVLPHSFGQLDE